MICPNCGFDYTDSYKKVKGSSRRKVVGIRDHYMLPVQYSGIYCPHCHQIMEFVKAPTGNPYLINAPVTDPKLLYTHHDFWKYLEETNQIEKFKNSVKATRCKGTINLELELH